MLKLKTEEELIDEENWELEQLECNKREELQKLPFIDAQIDYLKCDLGELESKREEIIADIKECQKGIKKIQEKRLDREYKKYLQVLWYKCLITENQTILDLWII